MSPTNAAVAGPEGRHSGDAGAGSIEAFHRHCGGREFLLDGGEDPFGVGAHPVDLVDEDERGNTEALQGADREPRL